MLFRSTSPFFPCLFQGFYVGSRRNLIGITLVYCVCVSYFTVVSLGVYVIVDQELHDNMHFGLLQVCGSLLVQLCDYLNVCASCDFVRLISVIHDYTGFARYLNDQSHGLFCFAIVMPSLFLYYFFI